LGKVHRPTLTALRRQCVDQDQPDATAAVVSSEA
jgi:hypothetical protein